MPLVLKRVVLDVLKPHHPPVHDFALRFGDIPKIKLLRVSILEIDEHTQTLKIEVEGEDIDLEIIEKRINELGGTVHSIDEVTVASSSRS